MNGLYSSQLVYLKLIKKRGDFESYSVWSEDKQVGIFNRQEYANRVYLFIKNDKSNRLVTTNILREGSALLYIMGVFGWILND